MTLIRAICCYLTLLFICTPATAEVELTPFVGFRMGGEFDTRNETDDSEGRVRLDDTLSQGILLNMDLEEPGTQLELYVGRQDTTADIPQGLLEPSGNRADITLYQLQFGGLYFPSGKTTGGFVSGVAGVTRLDPKSSDLDTHHRASLSLGGGYKFPLADNVLLRLDLRGIYTVLDSGGSVFCSGGCNIRFESSGYLQVEAAAGLAFRF